MKHVKSIVLVAIAFLMGLFYLVPAPSVSADTSSSSLSISPKKNYVIEPGDSVKDTLNISNLDDSSTLYLSLRVIDFSYTDHSGTAKLMTAQDAPQTTWSLRSMMSVPESVEVAPGKSKQVPISVSVPQGHGAGSYYSAIMYSSGTGQGAGQVGLNASGVTLVFVNIPGKVKENLQFTHLGAYDRSANGDLSGYHYFNAKMPDAIGYTLKNSGNVVEAPSGSITLRDIFGRTTTINEVNPVGSLALIGQERTYTACIKLTDEKVDVGGSSAEAGTCQNPGLWPGYYRVSADLYYGQNGNLTQEVTKTAGFWYLPWWFLIVSFIVIVVLVFFIRRTYNKLRNKFYGPKMKPASSRRRR